MVGVMTIISLALNGTDSLMPCPFCGSELELCNTHRASYWIECLRCGAEVQGRAVGSKLASSELRPAHHEKAKASAIARWNRRANAAPDSAVRVLTELHGRMRLEATRVDGGRAYAIKEHGRGSSLEAVFGAEAKTWRRAAQRFVGRRTIDRPSPDEPGATGAK